MRRHLIMLFISAFLTVSMPPGASGESGILSESWRPGDFRLVHNRKAADILVDAEDHTVVGIAASDLADDIEAVTGIRPSVRHESPGPNAVIIGTIGKSSYIDSLVKTGALDVSAIEGKWESFIIATLARPLPGVGEALVIAGSDRRGAAFGVYELSQQAGVSPWSWWADVTPERRDELIIRKGACTYGPPSVKYRGIFINDEDFGLQPWSAKTFEPELGDIGPKTYAKVFELLLRLKANHLWPAMHKCTRAFNYYEDNRVVADDYAIVMGSAHCEQMLRNNVDEWKRDGSGPWAYQINRKGVLEYWEDRVIENGKYENIYTLGMRAIHDSPMYAVGTTGQIINLYEKIISDQRELLRRHVNQEVTEVPQVFCPYNEMLYYYREGLDLPDDVTILWVDDNHGYIRQLSTPEEQERSGGSGVYYHVSYWGPPQDYLWLNTTSPALIWEEMKKSWDYNAREIWILNVGDIKPAEIATEFFLLLAWDIDRWDQDTAIEFLESFFGREFGEGHAREIADIMNLYYILNFQRRPEHMGFNRLGEEWVPMNDPDFSLFNYGDEARKRIEAFDEMEKRAEEIYGEIPPSKRDAYYQMVLYPVRASCLMNRKILHAYRSREYAKQGRAGAADYTAMAEDAFRGIQRETDYYNNEMAGGKWKEMMSYHPKDLTVFGMPETGGAPSRKDGSPGVSIEGMERPLAGAGGELPKFNRFTRKRYFIDIFCRGGACGGLDWEAKPDHDWITLSKSGGGLDKDERIWVDIDYGKAPVGDDVEGSVNISCEGGEYQVKISVFNPSLEIAENTFVQDNGVVSIDAGSFSGNRKGGNGAEWKIIRGMGRTGKAVGLLPFTSPSIRDMASIPVKAPVLEYPLYVFEPGQAEIIIHAVPTYPIHEGRSTSLAVSIDDSNPVLIEFEGRKKIFGVTFSEDLLRGAMISSAPIHVDKGPHTLKVFGLDPSVVIDKVLIDFGGLRESYLGPEETKN